jgi:serine/threonine protein kinase
MLVLLQQKGYDVVDSITLSDPANAKTKRFLINNASGIDMYCDIKKDPTVKYPNQNFEEVSILQEMNHKNIARYVNHFKDGEKILFIITESPKYQDIYSFMNVSEAKEIREGSIRDVTYQLLDVVKYLHNEDIAHNNITPSAIGVKSIVSTPKHLQINILLRDFVNACHAKNIKNTKLNGNALFYSPERFEGNTTLKSDIWAVAVTIFEITYGKTPWDGENFNDVKQRVTKEIFDGTKIDEAPGPWFPNNKYIGLRGKRVLTACFDPNPQTRPSATELLAKAWFDHVNLVEVEDAVDIARIRKQSEQEKVVANPQASSTKEDPPPSEPVDDAKTNKKATTNEGNPAPKTCGCC